jgi:adenine-specific DNA-methyltransferase
VAEGSGRLGKIANIDQGVVSGCDFVSSRNIDRMPRNTKIAFGDGIFVFDYDNPRDKDVTSQFSERERAVLKKFYKNSDIRPYWSESRATKRLLYIGRSMNSLDGLPHVAAHLQRFRPILSERREVENGRIRYFQLQWPRAEHIFTGEKMVVPYRAERNSFAYNSVEWFCRSDCYVLTKKNPAYDLRYLLALLNSKLYFQWLYQRGKRKGKMLELFQVPLAEIPVKYISKTDQGVFIDLASQILDRKKNDPEANTAALEADIDRRVYALYSLTQEEIAIVEGFATDREPSAQPASRAATK